MENIQILGLKALDTDTVVKAITKRLPSEILTNGIDFNYDKSTVGAVEETILINRLLRAMIACEFKFGYALEDKLWIARTIEDLSPELESSSYDYDCEISIFLD